MGLKDVRTRVIEQLREGSIQHEMRKNIDEKNLLLVGEVSPEDVANCLKKCQGTQYSVSPHHAHSGIPVHIFEPKHNGYDWYIKCYFLEPDVWFISVHRKKARNATRMKR